MTARRRLLRRVLRIVWLFPIVAICLSVLSEVVLLALIGYFTVLVGKVIGEEHIFVGIGAAPADAYGWWASLVLYLVTCFVLGTAWHFLAEWWFPEPREGGAKSRE